LIVAVSEKETISLSVIVHYLVKTPKVLEKLEKEIREQFQDDMQIVSAAMEGLPYLTTVIKGRLEDVLSGACWQLSHCAIWRSDYLRRVHTSWGKHLPMCDDEENELLTNRSFRLMFPSTHSLSTIHQNTSPSHTSFF